jgi:hypothetical protein
MDSSLFDEMVAAARGTLGLLMGDRRAPELFDFSLRGLAGSFIVLIVSVAANAYIPALGGTGTQVMHPWQAIVMIVLVYVLQIGLVAALLNRLRRLDGLLPYVVADNWATFFITIATTALTLGGISGDFALLAVGIVVLIIEINIARLVVTLAPMQVVMFLIAQFVGGLLGLLMLGMIVPAPPGA